MSDIPFSRLKGIQWSGVKRYGPGINLVRFSWDCHRSGRQTSNDDDSFNPTYFRNRPAKKGDAAKGDWLRLLGGTLTGLSLHFRCNGDHRRLCFFRALRIGLYYFLLGARFRQPNLDVTLVHF
jgi:hypothetical protein